VAAGERQGVVRGGGGGVGRREGGERRRRSRTWRRSSGEEEGRGERGGWETSKQCERLSTLKAVRAIVAL